MEEIKQVIVVRKDLNMRTGKLAAQVAHASMKVVLDKMKKECGKYTSEKKKVTDSGLIVFHDTVLHDEWSLTMERDTPLHKWLNGSFTKIVVYVNSEDELMKLYVDAESKGIPNALIQDAGKTEFKEPTYTCVAIGPDKSEKIDKITGELPLI